MRIVFMGTPQFAVDVLDKLMRRHDVVAVVSQPDRAKDRKGQTIFTPTKKFACEHGLPVLQFEKINGHADELKELNADMFVTAAYGQILSKLILDIPKYGILNVHASLLPEYRGSSPIQSAILNGESFTGVTIMQTDLGMDTGDILLSKRVEIGDKNSAELGIELAKVGAELLIEAIDGIEKGTITPVPQDERLASYCKKIDKGRALIDFGLNAQTVCSAVRAFNPVPVAFTSYKGERVKVYSASVKECSASPGEVVFADKKNGLVVACGQGSIRLASVQFPGKKVMSDVELLNGRKIEVGEYFGG